MSELNLNQYEQNALAEVTTVLALLKHRWSNQDLIISETYTDKLIDIVDKFDRVNWGDLYDRLHRTGANA